MDYKVVIALLAPLITAVGAYLIAKRTTSGSIDTSDAATLWAESQAMRKELRDEVISLRTELAEVRRDLTAYEKEKVIDHRKITELLSKIRKLEKHIQELGGAI